MFYQPLKVFDKLDTSLTEIKNKVMLPWPIDTKKIKFKILESAAVVDFKLDILGMDFAERYSLDPFMSESIYSFGKTRKLTQNGKR